jgi:DtxR family Mn-dependent transcriptional regulator
MVKRLSTNIQDYLKRIYELTLTEEKATTTQLAEALEISAASVTNMLQKLSKTDPPYLTYTKHHGVVLTEAGEQAALKIIRRHRLIEHYLVTALGYTWDEVHAEAEILEHAMSPLLEMRIDTALGYPKFDPHGDPIPNAQLQMPKIIEIPLTELKVEHSATILRVPNENPQVLRDIAQWGLRPGAHFRLISRTPYDQTMRLKVDDVDEDVIISATLGGQIFVSLRA